MSNNNLEGTIYKKINNLYRNAGYMSKYGSDVWTAAILCLVFIVLINYYYFVNLLEVVKADWPNQKCNPLLLPFAGFIQKPVNMSNAEFTVGNFNGCINNILKDVVNIAVKPLYFAVSMIQDTVNGLIEAVDKLRELTAGLRKEYASIINKIYNGINNLIVTFIGYTVKIKDSLAKVNGILVSSLYTLFGSYMALVSLFLSIIDFIILILICIAIICALFLVLSFIPIIGAFFVSPFKYSLFILILAMIPVFFFEIMLMRVMDLSTPPLPSIPGCFAGTTPIKLSSRLGERKKIKEIKDIEVGDILVDGARVTGIIKFAADDQNVYQLRGVYVTGEHRVFHSTLKWIKVKYHPESVYVATYNEPFVYCLNTNKKTLWVGETLFSDWDDIDEEVLADLRENCVVPGYLPLHFSLTDIHTHLDSGFTEEATVTLCDGRIVSLPEVKVNDILLTGEKIVGLVKIAAHDLAVYNYSFISGSRNIHVADTNLGIINGMAIEPEKKENHSERFLYHFLTDTKYVVINNIRFNDYNSGIDKYLRKFN